MHQHICSHTVGLNPLSPLLSSLILLQWTSVPFLSFLSLPIHFPLPSIPLQIFSIPIHFLDSKPECFQKINMIMYLPYILKALYDPYEEEL